MARLAGFRPRLYPHERLAATKTPKLPPQQHYHQFIDAILGRNSGKTHSAFLLCRQGWQINGL
ncbi:MAG: hypothetical protein K9N23_21395 [Akkermansiaceae bacterium]|nr:hypothetical protein [Akkermansiaceae bacterium]